MIRVGPFQFDDLDYDSESDVLYASIGKPVPAIGEDSPEGHVWRLAPPDDEVVGLTFIGPLQEYQRYGLVKVTDLEGNEHVVEGVEQALGLQQLA